MLTAYDFPFASILDSAGIDIILVGDSLGNNVLGYATSLPVTVEEMIYHTKAVTKAVKTALVVIDMPFMSYQESWNRRAERRPHDKRERCGSRQG